MVLFPQAAVPAHVFSPLSLSPSVPQPEQGVVPTGQEGRAEGMRKSCATASGWWVQRSRRKEPQNCNVAGRALGGRGWSPDGSHGAGSPEGRRRLELEPAWGTEGCWEPEGQTVSARVPAMAPGLQSSRQPRGCEVWLVRVWALRMALWPEAVCSPGMSCGMDVRQARTSPPLSMRTCRWAWRRDDGVFWGMESSRGTLERGISAGVDEKPPRGMAGSVHGPWA